VLFSERRVDRSEIHTEKPLRPLARGKQEDGRFQLPDRRAGRIRRAATLRGLREGHRGR